jgi:hypothetical protein
VPFSSEKQRRYLWANEPKIAHAWAHGKSSVTGKKESAAERGTRKSTRRRHKRTSARKSRR